MDVHCTLWYRDPLIWEEPEKFLPSRFLGADGESRANDFLPFQVLEILIAVFSVDGTILRAGGGGVWARSLARRLSSSLSPLSSGWRLDLVHWSSSLSSSGLLSNSLFSRTFTPTLVSNNAWEKGVHGFTLCPPDYTVSLAPCQLFSDSWSF